MFKTKVHAGLMKDCKVCTPEQKPKRRKDARVKFQATTGQDIVSALKQQLREEVGDAELTLPQQFALLQKFGANAVQIERKMSKPAWVEENEWKQRINQWIALTTGCKITGTQYRNTNRPVNQRAAQGRDMTQQRTQQFKVQKKWQKPLQTSVPKV